MATRGAGSAKLSLQITLPGQGSWIPSLQQPLTVGIVDTGAEAQAPLRCPGDLLRRTSSKGKLLVEDLSYQTPAARGCRLLEGQLQQPVLLRSW
jgi:hypothetical protein